MNPTQSSKYSQMLKEQTLLWAVACLLFILVLTGWIYRAGLAGPLLLDDIPNLSALQNFSFDSLESYLAFVFGNSSGPGGRPVSMASFLLDGTSWPLNSERLKTTNSLVHLLCAIPLFVVVQQLSGLLGHQKTKCHLIALIVTSYWLLHPLNVSTVLYVVQRMTQLATFFALVSIAFYLYGRQKLPHNPKVGTVALIISIAPFAVLSIFSKEIGVLIFPSILLMECAFFSKRENSPLFKLWFNSLVIAPCVVILLYILLTLSSTMEYYAYRDFSLMERLLTEPRVLCSYLLAIFVPFISNFGLYHDAYVVSESIIQPATTLLALGFLVGLGFLAAIKRTQHPVFFFGVMWFFVWHFLEATYVPLELYFEHRNYLAMLGPLFCVTYYLVALVSKLNEKNTIGIVMAIAVASIGLLALQTSQQTKIWGNTGVLISTWAEEFPDSKRAQSDMAILLGEIGIAPAGAERLARVRDSHPNEVTALLQSWNFHCAHGLSAAVSINELKSTNLTNKHDNINTQFRTFVDHQINATCGVETQVDVLEVVENFSTIAMDNRDFAVFNIIYSELLVHYDMIDRALEKLDIAYIAEASIDTAIRQSTLAGSVGRLEQAEAILLKAYETDEARGFFTLGRRAEIDSIQAQIDSARQRRTEG